MSDEEPKKKEAAAGAPAWMATFADLMSLLLTFFILLLTFAEINAKKFEDVKESIKDAFGVQDIEVILNRPSSNTALKSQFGHGAEELENLFQLKPKLALQLENFCQMEKARIKKEKQELEKQASQLKQRLEARLRKEISNKVVFIKHNENEVTISIDENKGFVPSSPKLRQSFLAPLRSIIAEVSQTYGDVSISAFKPKANEGRSRFSRWQLSTSRALFLAYSMNEFGQINDDRLGVDTKSNDNPRAPASVAQGQIEMRIQLDFDPNANF